jgi:hypothetical protein
MAYAVVSRYIKWIVGASPSNWASVLIYITRNLPIKGTVVQSASGVTGGDFKNMTVSGKRFHGLTLRCFGAIGVGLAIVALITVGLLVVSGESETGPSTRTAAYTLKFPEDEQMLKDLSAQILKDSNMATPGKDYADIQPASGGTAPAKDQPEGE